MKSYLPGLNTVRLYAAICVVIIHVTTGSHIPGVLSGPDAVSLFFVLSGYLITYRLLKENEDAGAFNLKQFYIRRELRILPLYYLIFIVAGFVLPIFAGYAASSQTLLFAALLLPQIPFAVSSMGATGMIGHLWSIGVEECFYIVFPALLKRIALIPLCLFIIAVCSIVQWYGIRTHQLWADLAITLRFQCMAVGALGAWIAVDKRWLKVLFHPFAQLIGIGGILLVILFDVHYWQHYTVFAVFIVVFLVNISLNTASIIRLEWTWSKRLGDLTYGIYIYHYPLSFVFKPWFSGVSLFTAVAVPTFIIAWFSYQYIEKPIMRLARPYTLNIRPSPSETAANV